MDDCALTPEQRVAGEIAFFENIDLQALPAIYNYWSAKFISPMLLDVFGSADLWGFIAEEFRASIIRTGNPIIASIGAGDGEVEMVVAQRLLGMGVTEFWFECLELSPHLIERGRANAKAMELDRHVQFVETDLTHWQPRRRYGATFANHSLHHILALEHVFDQMHRSMEDGATFVTSDMIGRNGHMRWPETEAILSTLWRVMPDRYRYNHQLKRHEPEFINWDCSTIGFEGIRAQDIMPELLKRFHFHRYCAWGGITDPFIDRCFGHNLRPDNAEDCAFMDGIAEANRKLLLDGFITPTQLIAFMRKEIGDLVSNGLDPVKGVHHSL